MSEQIIEEPFSIIEDFSAIDFHGLFLNKDSIEKNTRKSIQIWYLKRYLSYLGCKSILVENSYIDRDYLMDYQDFYVRCSKNYNRKCKRAHFFSCKLDKDTISKIIETPSKQEGKIDEIKNSYLGFTVIKPLPDKVIGKTCIKHYPEKENRHFYSVKKYYSNLFGINFHIETLAFQQQDTIMAACATVSLWCAFHQTSEIFGHYIPSPGQITKSATLNIIDRNRVIPSQGLAPEQICDAIRHVGLTYETFSVEDKKSFLGIIHSYLKMHLPIIMGFLRPDNKYHAVTITGYKLEDPTPKDNGEVEKEIDFEIVSDNISELYIHDDQIGPFSRVFIKEKSEENVPKVFIKYQSYKGDDGDNEDGEDEDIKEIKKLMKNVKLIPLYSFSDKYVSSKPGIRLELEYPDTDDEDINSRNSENKEVIPHVLIIPLYEKIRINYTNIYKEANRINAFIKSIIKTKIIWDIFLYTSNKFKEEILKDDKLPIAIRTKILTDCMPKYIWRCQVKMQNTKKENEVFLELIFDSTDISGNTSFLYFLSGDEQKKFLKTEYEKIKKETDRSKITMSLVDKEFIKFFEDFLNR
ncbi:MAG: hypothetical protein HPY60_09630 [Candidatus Methanofastidiosum sp.]|nr:hypothetical protein [Methanofastidiosum sp.]